MAEHLAERGDDLHLAGSAGVSDDADRDFGAARGDQDGGRFLDLGDAPLAAGVVERHHEIGVGGGAQPLSDGFQRRHQVGEGDDGKIVHQGRAQHGGRRLDRGDPGNHDDLDALVGGGRAVDRSVGKLEGESRHAVDAGVAAGDQRDQLSRGGDGQGLGAALHLAHHSRGDHFLARQKRLDERQVGLVTDHHVSLLDRLTRLEGHMVQPAGADTHHK